MIGSDSAVSVFYDKEAERLGYRSVSFFDAELSGMSEERDVKAVLVKPNLCIGIGYESGVVVHPDFVEGAVNRLREHFPNARMIVGESHSRQVFERTGFVALEEKGVELLDLEEDSFVYRFDGKEIQEISLPSVLDGVDLILNVGKLKVHRLAITSICVKNLMGFLSKGSERGRMHELTHEMLGKLDRAFNEEEFEACEMQLARRLVDLYFGFTSFLKERNIPMLNCADGYIVSEGDGFHLSTPRAYYGGLAAFNAWNLDHVGSRLMGRDPESIAYLKEGEKAGYYDPSKIQIKGTPRITQTPVTTFKDRYFKEIRDAFRRWETLRRKRQKD
jgi:uncharacterized protein (DUF362 family)